MRKLVLTLVLAVLPGMSVHGQFGCGPGNEDCYEPHESPGCLQPGCCELVCKTDMFCCEETWDETCVKVAEGLCGDIECPNWGSCNEFHETPGCLDESCCEHVRLHDPFCGWGIWDETCVLEAAELCGIVKCQIDPPEEFLLEYESCLERLNDGCGLEVPAYVSLYCGKTLYGTCVTSVPRDTDWLRLSSAVETLYTLTLRPEFPGRLLLVDGACDGPLRTLDQAVAPPCGEVKWELLLPPGEFFIVVDAGNELRTIRSGLPCDEIDPDDPPKKGEEPPPSYYGLRYLLSLECEALEGLPGDLNGDGRVSGIDMGLFLVGWGPNPGHPADFNGDGVVDGIDLGVLLINWTA